MVLEVKLKIEKEPLVDLFWRLVIKKWMIDSINDRYKLGHGEA